MKVLRMIWLLTYFPFGLAMALTMMLGIGLILLPFSLFLWAEAIYTQDLSAASGDGLLIMIILPVYTLAAVHLIIGLKNDWL